MVTFRGSAAKVALPPTWSVEAAAARLIELPTGGQTPLAAGLPEGTIREEDVRPPAVWVVGDVVTLAAETSATASVGIPRAAERRSAVTVGSAHRAWGGRLGGNRDDEDRSGPLRNDQGCPTRP
jgi:magnesium chelatase subunit D